MNLQKQKWTEVEYGQVVNHIEVNERDPEKRAIAKYVSVEHLDTLDLRIKGVAPEEKHTFTRTFRKGQILFAKRRAYQKKVAVADFDGICSPHLWALETNGNLLQELLPFIMQRDVFYEYVNANSAGTMSTYLKWPALSKYKFYLPPIEEQKSISKLLWGLEDLIIQTENQEIKLKNLRQKIIDDLIDKSLFGKVIKRNELKSVKFGEIVSNNTKAIKDPLDEGLSYAIGLENITPNNLNVNSLIDIKEEGTNFKRYFEHGQLLFGARRAYLRQMVIAPVNGVCTANIMVFDTKNKFELSRDYMYLIAQSNSFVNYATSTSVGSLFPNAKWNSLKDFELQIPNLKTQNIITDFIQDCQILIENVEYQKDCLTKLKFSLLDKIFEL